MQTDKTINIEDSVMNQIKRNKVKMLPKWYFVMSTIVASLSIALSISLGILALNLIIFSSRGRGNMRPACFDEMLSAYPWWAVPVVAFGFVFAWWLYKKSGNAYKHSKIAIALIIAGSILVGGVSINLFKLDEVMEKRGPLKGLYHHYGQGRMHGVGVPNVK